MRMRVRVSVVIWIVFITAKISYHLESRVQSEHQLLVDVNVHRQNR